MYSTPRRRGLSLVEILVVITVVAVLVAIAAPALHHVFVASREVDRLSWARQLGLAVELYTADHDGAYPFLAMAGAPDEPIVARGVPVSRLPRYNRYFWLNAVHPAYLRTSVEAMACVLDGGPPDGAFGNVPKGVLLSGWTLSSTTAAAPSFWRTGAPASPGLLRAMGRAPRGPPLAQGPARARAGREGVGHLRVGTRQARRPDRGPRGCAGRRLGPPAGHRRAEPAGGRGSAVGQRARADPRHRGRAGGAGLLMRIGRRAPTPPHRGLVMRAEHCVA